MRSDARKRLTPHRMAGPIIGLIGKKRSGKDTFAATLVEERGFARFAFADPLKEAALSLDPLIRLEQDETHLSTGGFVYGERIERLSAIVGRVGWERAKEIREVRRTLQNYGVAIREIDEGFWVRGTLDRALAHPGPVVVTDVRFPNEAEAILNAGGRIVRIVRPGLASDDSHVSETALDGYPADLDVLNSGTVEMLAETARHITF
jgi:hypothetical protein